jgi:hypothetical protein
MGYNIAGLVINQNYGKDISKLSEDLGWKIEDVEEISFEAASKNWTPDDEFRLYFSDKATMIFFPLDWVADSYHSKTADTLNFAYSETAGAFQVDLFRKEACIRSIFEHEGRIMMQAGERLELEATKDSVSGLVFPLINDLLGQDFWSIDPMERAFSCNKTN